MSYYKTGQQDCGNTFDLDTFDLKLRKLAREVERIAGGSSKRDVQFVARQVALEAVAKSEDWISERDWTAQTYEPDPKISSYDAYWQWRAGYTHCATAALTHWILEELGVSP